MERASATTTNAALIAQTIALTRIYQMGASEVTALADVNLSFQRGDYWAVMGPSGSGKSTLLNMLGCLDRPTTGRYLLDGEDVSELTDDELSQVRSEKLGFIFQSFNLIPQLSVLENIEVPLFYQGVAPARSRERAMQLAELVGLSNRLAHKPLELSGGQQQRVAIARALANDPVIILADEPTGNLDSKTSREILDMLDSLSSQGKTIVMVTHDENTSRRARCVLRMKDGRVEDIEQNR
ncbi:MAG: ABC transporter ATP-binding protein [Planctomycetota bacterium]